MSTRPLTPVVAGALFWAGGGTMIPPPLIGWCEGGPPGCCGWCRCGCGGPSDDGCWRWWCSSLPVIAETVGEAGAGAQLDSTDWLGPPAVGPWPLTGWPTCDAAPPPKP